jgi:hypothetical protein
MRRRGALVPPEERQALQHRAAGVELATAVGKTRVVASHQDAQSGFYCEACDRVYKDSIAYLDHINSGRHIVNTGAKLKVERPTVDRIKERLAAKKREADASRASEPVRYDLGSKVAAAEAEELARKVRGRRPGRRWAAASLPLTRPATPHSARKKRPRRRRRRRRSGRRGTATAPRVVAWTRRWRRSWGLAASAPPKNDPGPAAGIDIYSARNSPACLILINEPNNKNIS